MWIWKTYTQLASLKGLFSKGVFLAGATLFLASCQVQNQPANSRPITIGLVTNSSGYPEVTRRNQTYILAKQSRIYKDDVLRTDKDSKVQITMNDGTTIALGPETHFVLHRYDLINNQSVSKANMTMTGGSLKTDIAPINTNSSFEIRTPLAVLSTTRAEFWSSYSILDNTLNIAMVAGENLIVENNHGATRLNRLAWGTSVIGDSAPQPAKAWSTQKLDQALEATNLKPGL